MTRVKICGLTRQEDIESVNRWLPDYVGFVFCQSRRQVAPQQAAFLKARLAPRIKAVGVFVNEPVQSVVALCGAGVIDLVQLHGAENAAYLRELKAQTDCPVIKAVRVQSAEQIRQADTLPCDFLLLDTYQRGQYGGGGKPFDHTIIPRLAKPFFLAGGLNGGNITQAIRACKPYGVDISSGVETDGRKDDEKIRLLIRAVRLAVKKASPS